MSGLTYPGWSINIFETRIAPTIAAKLSPVLNLECGPGPYGGQYRLYPGALFLLWTCAIGGPQASMGAEPIAAALEMLHNSSLVHDDVLDDHALRRGQSTLLRLRGHNFALLAGDILMARAMQTLGGLDVSRLSGVVTRLAEAAATMIEGQMNDESDLVARRA